MLNSVIGSALITLCLCCIRHSLPSSGTCRTGLPRTIDAAPPQLRTSSNVISSRYSLTRALHIESTLHEEPRHFQDLQQTPHDPSAS
ncbi:uncharacterized protein BKA55DRAFT_573924 [Fusarium redolens]|uniref:Secreted protein n=1 Tax=Fusarium redolens TaxID=48865 RepID=A0A9P9GRP7_FUSRE|nr:uncharacterized protein BKA55DRAFT_573924 [Fusarium redolens]KAH7244443.1 hypothetical protein BKA55DRAFT_573924 [Fusarium redolens]